MNNPPRLKQPVVYAGGGRMPVNPRDTFVFESRVFRSREKDANFIGEKVYFLLLPSALKSFIAGAEQILVSQGGGRWIIFPDLRPPTRREVKLGVPPEAVVVGGAQIIRRKL